MQKKKVKNRRRVESLVERVCVICGSYLSIFVVDVVVVVGFFNNSSKIFNLKYRKLKNLEICFIKNVFLFYSYLNRTKFFTNNFMHEYFISSSSSFNMEKNHLC